MTERPKVYQIEDDAHGVCINLAIRMWLSEGELADLIDDLVAAQARLRAKRAA